MPYVRLAGVLIALTVFCGAVGLVFAGGLQSPTSGGSTAPPPAPPPRPAITAFSCEPEGDGYWTFYGTVANSAAVASLSINFDGLKSVNGQSVAVNPDGSFELTIQLQPNETGVVGAVLEDANGTEYDDAETLVT